VISISRSPLELLAFAIVAALFLRHMMAAAFHVHLGWRSCGCVGLACLMFPILLPAVAATVAGFTIWRVVRWFNDRDDPDRAARLRQNQERQAALRRLPSRSPAWQLGHELRGWFVRPTDRT